MVKSFFSAFLEFLGFTDKPSLNMNLVPKASGPNISIALGVNDTCKGKLNQWTGKEIG